MNIQNHLGIILQNKLLSKDITPYNDNGEMHGYWEEYFNNGKLKYTGTYVNGKKHGSFSFYYPTGEEYKTGTYVKGKKHGVWCEYYTYQNLAFKENFINGKEIGYEEFYRINRISEKLFNIG